MADTAAMLLAIPLMFVGLLAAVLWLLRESPLRVRLGLSVIGLVASATAALLGFELGRIDSMYRSGAALVQLIRATSRTLDAGECDRAQAAYARAAGALEKGTGAVPAAKDIARALDPAQPTPPEPAATP